MSGAGSEEVRSDPQATPRSLAHTDAARPLPLARWAALGALLLGEYLGLSVLFDAKTIANAAGDALPGLLSRVGFVGPLVIVVAAAVLLVSGRALHAELLRAWSEDARPAPPVVPVLANLACYGALLLTTQRVFAQVGSGATLPWVLVWLASACGTAIALLPAALPWPVLRGLLPRVAGALGAGCAAGLLAFLAGLASAELWGPLSRVTLHLTASLLRLAGSEIVFLPEDAILGLRDFQVTVAPVCSGYEGIGLAIAFVGLHLWTARGALRFPNAYLLLPIAVALVFLANSLRIALLIWVGAHVSPVVALSGFHSKAGWLLFCAIALGLIALSRGSRFFAADGSEHTGQIENPAAPYLMPLLALMTSMLVTGLFDIGFDRLYPLRVAVVGGVLWWYRKALAPLLWPVSWPAPLLGAGVYVLWIALAERPDAGAVDALDLGLADLGPTNAALWLACRAIGHVATVPIAEELAFRGYLLRRVMRADFLTADPQRWQWSAAILSSVAFGALHAQQWPVAIAAGLIFAYAQKMRGRLADAVSAHVTANALIAADALLRGNLWLWA